MLSASDVDVYSAIVSPTYQRTANHAPVKAMIAGNNNNQRKAGGLNLSVMTDGRFVCGTGLQKSEVYESPFAGICGTDLSGLSEIASRRIDKRRSSTLRASHSLRISAILSSEIRGVEIKTCST